MALDPSWARGVACALLISCGPRVQTGPTPPAEPSSVARVERAPHPTGGRGRQVVVGEMCPTGAGGRPAIAPLVMRGLQWTADPTELGNTIERGATSRFLVFGTDGKQAGLFDTIGLADVGLQQSVATGAYVGGAPCSADAGQGNRADDPKCAAALAGCGLAVAEIVRPDDPPETVGFATGRACLAGDAIAIDIDGDGTNEAFPIAAALDGIRAPAAEWSAAAAIAAPCKGSFQLYDIPIEVAGKPDPKSTVTIDVLGVIDLDGDTRKEVVLAMRFPTVRTIAVYAPLESPQRLELVGEATSFPRP